jgi:hypothetical protein
MPIDGFDREGYILQLYVKLTPNMLELPVNILSICFVREKAVRRLVLVLLDGITKHGTIATHARGPNR